MTDEQGYNGWRNHATWATALHWDNDEGTYSWRREMADQAEMQAKDRDEAIDLLAEMIETATDEMVDELLGAGYDWARLYISDMMSDGVDWREIAANWVDEEDRTWANMDDDA